MRVTTRINIRRSKAWFTFNHVSAWATAIFNKMFCFLLEKELLLSEAHGIP
jgi:hypothetical protein